MIRINLSGAPRPKKGKRAAVPSVAGEGPNPMIVIAVLVVMGLAGNGWYYTKLSREAKDLATKKEAAMADNHRLAAVKAKFEEAEKEKDTYRKRVDVIDKLRSAQSGPVTLLNTIGDTINSTDAVWLLSMKDNGNDVSIDGTALSANAVANLIANLKKTGYFKNVEIKETFQDASVRDMQAFQFQLTCEKAEKKS